MSVDKYLDRRFHRQNYNCLDFVCDVWKDEVGEDLRPILYKHTGCRRSFVELEAPSEPCIVLLRRSDHTPHVGIYLRGRILHIHELGVEFFPLDVVAQQYSSVKFYNVRD